MPLNGELSPLTGPQKAVAVAVGVAVVLYVGSSLLMKGYGVAFFGMPIFIGFVAGV